jgi:segregation and condensation protein A
LTRQNSIDFDEEMIAPDDALIVGVDGFEGPLDLLLELARRQKLDLARISILALAEQYLAFVAEARALRLELAADYLVMAAWLAYLKSRLLLPKSAADGEPEAAEDMALALVERLRRLEQIRAAAQALLARPRLGVDVFQRGAPEALQIAPRAAFTASLHDLLTAYARQRQTRALAHVTIEKRFVWSLADARTALERLVGRIDDWTPIDRFLIEHAAAPAMRRSVVASSFAVLLELVREGALEVRQDQPFDPLMLRRRPSVSAAVTGLP